MTPIEKCPEDGDMASQHQEQLNEMGRAKVLAASAPQSHPDFDGVHCLECDVDMPAERLAARRIRCTVCEGQLERIKKTRGG